ncbi:tetratricopeptide repeat protein [Lichenibacterium ramalinae]|uniref:Tetratricopeptide repeat protein n=1 Tax=Lichenibacterium ramalinae TaxID=2316527 RepID=A0A4Q2RFI2_9HYPH|nr:tetratricopeptide repeat protein [Lichenibacterium ramalinae]RYB04332.1 tetratricopeptide repeat protein [Lichenibacterium ramalinae]
MRPDEVPAAVRLSHEIPKPKDWQSFERGCLILFRAELRDPTMQSFGRGGQNQRGIDLVGRRENRPGHSVGVQCRRTTKHDSPEKILSDCRAAIGLGLDLKELIFATTAPNDVKATLTARTVENELRADGHDLRVVILGWGNLEEMIARHEEAYRFFFPAVRPDVPDPVAKAEAHLATMPLDALPDGGLPSLHLLPWPRNLSFVGRKCDLLSLARQLHANRAAAVGQSPVLTGMGGLGKSQLAVEFAYRYGHWFAGGVFWVDCAVPSAVAEAVAACGLVLYPNQPGFSARPLPERVALVRDAWAGNLPRLLIFDNCEDEALVDAWAPKAGGCRVLITARRQSWSAARGIVAVPLGILERCEGLALLRHHRPDLRINDPDLDAIAEELGDLPLALELAGRYLARYRDESAGVPHAYLDALRADLLTHASLAVEDPEAPGQTRPLTPHEANLARTFLVSLNRLRVERPDDALARDLFGRAACLSPGAPIPRFLLKRCAGIEPEDAAAGLPFADALTRLAELALVEPAREGAIVLHRLLAAFGRARLDQGSTVRSAVQETLAAEARHWLLHNDPSPLRTWSVHLIAAAVEARRDGTLTAARLVNEASYYSLLEGDPKLGQSLIQDTLPRLEANFGRNHHMVAVILGTLGKVQSSVTDLAAAEASHTRALDIFEGAEDPDQSQIAVTLGNLGNVQRERGDLESAEASHTRALEIKEKLFVLAPNSPSIARSLGNLAIVQRQRGKLVEAEASQTRVLVILRNSYGRKHPDVARAFLNLGNVQLERGKLPSAQANQKRALAILRKIHLGDHSIIAYALGGLGNVQEIRGDLAGAEASQTRALAMKERLFGLDHPEVAITLTNLGGVHRSQGRTAEAYAECSRALPILTKAFGEQHAHTLEARKLIEELDGKT